MLDMPTALDMPHAVNRNGKTGLEEDTPVAAHKTALKALSHEVNVRATIQGVA